MRALIIKTALGWAAMAHVGLYAAVVRQAPVEGPLALAWAAAVLAVVLHVALPVERREGEIVGTVAERAAPEVPLTS
jgi:hypothetical protein